MVLELMENEIASEDMVLELVELAESELAGEEKVLE